MKLLIVEDERELSESIVCFLRHEDYLCEQAFTYDEAMLRVAVYEYDCVLLDLMLVSVGFTLTASTTLALDCAREEAGTASALFGAVGFVAGGVVSPLVGMGSIMHSSAITFVTAAVLALAFAVPALRRSAAAH